MLGYVGKDKNWVLHDREPRPGWTRATSRCSAMRRIPPCNTWPGACMAIEDAVVFSGKLEKAGSDVNSALQAYEQERYLRTCARHDHFADLRRHHPRERRRARPAQSSACAEDARNLLGVDWLYRGSKV